VAEVRGAVAIANAIAAQACYICHANYAMFGGFRAKLNGLQHVYVQHFGTPHNPIRLYEPYNNRECLHCHLARDPSKKTPPIPTCFRRSRPTRSHAFRAAAMTWYITWTSWTR